MNNKSKEIIAGCLAILLIVVLVVVSVPLILGVNAWMLKSVYSHWIPHFNVYFGTELPLVLSWQIAVGFGFVLALLSDSDTDRFKNYKFEKGKFVEKELYEKVISLLFYFLRPFLIVFFSWLVVSILY